MKINYDKTADAMYIRLKKGIVKKTIKMKDRLLVDVDKNGNILGMELLQASTQIPKKQINTVELGMVMSA